MKGLIVRKGNLVGFRGETWVVLNSLGPRSVFLRSVSGQRTVVAEYQALLWPKDVPRPSGLPDLASISDKIWTKQLTSKLRVILEIRALPENRRGAAAIKAILNRLRSDDPPLNISLATAYRWWKQRDTPEDLLAATRGDLGRGRLDPLAEAIIQFALQRYLLNRIPDSHLQTLVPEAALKRLEKPLVADAPGFRRYLTVPAFIKLVINMFEDAGLPPEQRPHPNTLRNRAEQLEQTERLALLRATQGRKALRKLRPVDGPHLVARPGQEWQGDHLRTDVHIVHKVSRKPIGRAWLTLIIDVYSRMVVGWYLTLEAPSIMSINLALVQAILPKTDLKLEHGLAGDWDCWGLPLELHLDNAREFRSETLARFALSYGIGLRWRPVGRPQFGGHIERLAGTFAGRFKNYRGASFSSIQERGERETEASAVYDFEQFRKMVALDIHTYNHTLHSSINTTPWECYRDGVFGPDGLGPGELFEGEAAAQMKIDGLPFTVHTVQREGIKWDHIYYASPEALGPLIKDGKKYVIRRNPYDISRIYLWHPEQKVYYTVPYRDRTKGPMSIWEHRAALKELREAGHQAVNHGLLSDAVDRQRRITDEAVEKKRGAGRLQERRRLQQADRVPASPEHAEPTPDIPANAGPVPGDGSPPPSSQSARGTFMHLDLNTLTPLENQRIFKPGDEA